LPDRGNRSPHPRRAGDPAAPVATLAVTIIFGWIFLVSGMVGFVTTMGARGAPGFWWSLVSAVLATAAGLILLIQPVGGALSLTPLLVVVFAIEGAGPILFPLGPPPQPHPPRPR